ncbi:MAG: cytochrome c-type biogenesis protein [Rhodospirillales bacterium]
MKGARVALMLLALLAAPGARAVEPDEMLKNPALESRARDISQHLRCLVCQNQSIDDSNAPLARDLRLLVRERLIAGDSDTEVLDYLVRRYGSFVLLKPPMNPQTYLLWFGPFAVLALGAFTLWRIARRRPREAASPLTADEKRRLEGLLAETGESESKPR